MAIPIMPGEIVKVWLPEDENKSPEQRTLFHLAAMTYKIQRRLLRHAAMIPELEEKTTEARKIGHEVVNVVVSDEFFADTLGVPGAPLGLVGWENFKTLEGKEIIFNPATYLDYLSAIQQLLLAMKVMGAQYVTKAERKN